MSDNELTPEQEGLAKVGVMLAQVVENALRPALDGHRVPSCLHILDEVNKRSLLPLGGAVDAGAHQGLLCPMHPDRLLCNMTKCLHGHYQRLHAEEPGLARCFVCEESMVDPVTGEVRNFEGVNARVQLHQKVPFYDDNRRRGQWFTFSGDLWTLPVAYLCPRDAARLELDLPIRMAWPTSAGQVTPEMAWLTGR